MLAVLTLYLFLSFFSSIPLFLIFFSFVLLVSISWLSSFQYVVLMVVVVPVHDNGPFFIVPAMTKFYYFSP